MSKCKTKSEIAAKMNNGLGTHAHTCFVRGHTSTDRCILFHQCFVLLITGSNSELYSTLSPYGCEEHRNGIKRVGLHWWSRTNVRQKEGSGKSENKRQIQSNERAHSFTVYFRVSSSENWRTPHLQIFLNVPFYSSLLSLQWSLPSFILSIPIVCVCVSVLMYVRIHSSRSGGCNPQVRQDGISADSVDPDT